MIARLTNFVEAVKQKKIKRIKEKKSSSYTLLEHFQHRFRRFAKSCHETKREKREIETQAQINKELATRSRRDCAWVWCDSSGMILGATTLSGLGVSFRRFMIDVRRQVSRTLSYN
jgi:hypothetical protein